MVENYAAALETHGFVWLGRDTRDTRNFAKTRFAKRVENCWIHATRQRSPIEARVILGGKYREIG